MLLQRRIDEVLEGVRLSDLLEAEGEVRARVEQAFPFPARRALPVLSS